MDVVDRSFISQIEGSLERFRERGDDYNFRCPCCGDSKKSDTKARGWLRWKAEERAYRYSCYNCGESLTLLGLIKAVRPSLADAYTAAKFKEAGRSGGLEENRAARRALTAKPVFAPSTAPAPITEPPPPVVAPKGPPFPRFPDVKRIEEVDWALEYVASRHVPFEELAHIFVVDDIRDVAARIEAYKDTKFRRLSGILFPYYGVNGGLEYLQARTHDPNLRYITFEVSGGGKLWGRHRIKDSGRIFLFEGAFDAVCVRNAAASGGVDLIRAAHLLRDEYPNAETCLVYDKDWKVNAEVYDQVIRAVDLGFTVVFPDGPQKDVNDLIVKSAWTPEQVEAMLNSRALSGLRAKLEIAKVRKPLRERKKWKSSTPTT